MLAVAASICMLSGPSSSQPEPLHLLPFGSVAVASAAAVSVDEAFFLFLRFFAQEGPVNFTGSNCGDAVHIWIINL